MPRAETKKTKKKKTPTKTNATKKSAPKRASQATKGTKKPAASAKKPAASAKKPTASAKKPARKEKKAPTLLTSDQRRKLLKPREGFDDLIERVARTWDSARSLRVPGLSVPRLLKLLRDARRAAEREESAREKLERALRPLYDGRLLAENEVWRAVLDVNAAVKLFARSDGSLAETFGFLTEALTTNSGARAAAESAAAESAGAEPAEPAEPAGRSAPVTEDG